MLTDAIRGAVAPVLRPYGDALLRTVVIVGAAGALLGALLGAALIMLVPK